MIYPLRILRTSAYCGVIVNNINVWQPNKCRLSTLPRL